MQYVYNDIQQRYVNMQVKYVDTQDQVLSNM